MLLREVNSANHRPRYSFNSCLTCPQDLLVASFSSKAHHGTPVLRAVGLEASTARLPKVAISKFKCINKCRITLAAYHQRRKSSASMRKGGRAGSGTVVSGGGTRKSSDAVLPVGGLWSVWCGWQQLATNACLQLGSEIVGIGKKRACLLLPLRQVGRYGT